MNESDLRLEPRMTQALEELAEMIVDEFPTATFRVSRGESPNEIWLLVYADVEDTEHVLNVVIDRGIDMLVDDGLFITVLPHSRAELAACHGERSDDEYAALEWVPSLPFMASVPTGA